MAKQRHNILVLNGPNLNMLGTREPESYGFKNLSAIALECEEYASELGMALDFRQSNSEGEIVTIIQEAREGFSGVIINAAAYGQTSLAIHDALRLLDIPVIDVQLDNVFKRDPARRASHVAPLAAGVICGFGGHGYLLALQAMRALLDEE